MTRNAETLGGVRPFGRASAVRGQYVNGHSGAWERRFNPNRKKRFPVSSCPSQVIEMEDWDTITELAEKAVAESLK